MRTCWKTPSAPAPPCFRKPWRRARRCAFWPEPVSTEEFWGEEHLHGLLELLALLPLKSGEHFPFYLNALYDDIRSTDIALVTCYLDEPILQFARDKQDAGVHVRLYVLDPGADAAQEDLDIYLPRWKARGREGGDEQS